MKKRSASEMLDDAREELVSLRTVPDGGEGHTKTDELKMGNKRAARLLRSVTPEIISVIGAVSLGANMAAYTDGFKLSLHSIQFLVRAETPFSLEDVRGKVEVFGVVVPLFDTVLDIKNANVLSEEIVIAARLRKEMIEQHIAEKIKKEEPNE